MSTEPALVIAAHGTRLAAGQRDCQQLAELVSGQLPGVEVRLGHVELVDPHIDQVVEELLERHEHLVVTPLMLGTGAHVRRDIPDMVGQGAQPSGRRADVTLTPHLGQHPLLLDALWRRVREAMADGQPWDEAETMVVLVGRGSLVPQANADHVALARLLREGHNVADVLTGFIQVTTPDVAAALDRAVLLRARRIVLAPNFLFAGRLDGWLHQQADAWAAEHPDVELRVAGVIGPCAELASVVAERYRQAAHEHRAQAMRSSGSPMYLSGLDLKDRRVLLAGGGAVATRRLVRLLAAGARVEVVAPRASTTIQDLALQGRIGWQQRPAGVDDVAGAWYVLACTDDPATNRALTEAATRQRIFCVRADDARHGTAWTPATESVGGFTVGVLGNRDPRGSVRLRQRIIDTLQTETLTAEED
ncbi:MULTISPECIES: CbiX/SirB N-terminal domain-containing protein [unclassified Luteococcus]|uniref:CbiX/SirB N-terminal domain-containing protein n=1 Tax=unclassified Luteococcus TaxID=2639923 RepID=UPI00313E0178